MSAPDWNTWTLTLNGETIRDHFGDAHSELFLDVEALTDAELTEAGAVVINRLSDQFWEAVDELFFSAVLIAKQTKREVASG